MSISQPINLFVFDSFERTAIIDTTSIPTVAETLKGSFTNLKGYGVTPYGTTEYGYGTDYSGDVDSDFRRHVVTNEINVPNPILDFPILENTDIVEGVGPVTITRDSLGTYLDKNTGFIRNCAHNLLLNSESIDSWSDYLQAPTVYIDQEIAPDGLRTADRIEDTSLTQWEAKGQFISVVDDKETYTVSFHLLKNSATAIPGLNLTFSGGTTKTATFRIDSSTGSFVSHTNIDNVEVVLEGNWWRVSLTITNNGLGNTNLNIRLFPATRTFLTLTDSVNAVGSAVFWGIQIEKNITSSLYCKTTSTAFYAPRFETVGYKFEGSRTNRITSSESMESWLALENLNDSISVDYGLAPNNIISADKFIVGTDDSAIHRQRKTVTTVPIGLNTFSIYLKDEGVSYGRLLVWNATESATIFFDLATGILGNNAGSAFNSAYIESAPNGWYRIIITLDTTVEDSFTCMVYCDSAFNSAASWAGDGIVAMGMWGGQFEEAPFVSSYIKTIASEVTRTIDIAELPLVNFPRSDKPFSITHDLFIPYSSIDQHTFNIQGENHILIRPISSTPSLMQCYLGFNNSIQQTAPLNKVSLISDTTNFWTFSDGVKSTLKALVATTGTPTKIQLGIWGAVNPLFGNISNLRIYDYDLTDEQYGEIFNGDA